MGTNWLINQRSASRATVRGMARTTVCRTTPTRSRWLSALRTKSLNLRRPVLALSRQSGSDGVIAAAVGAVVVSGVAAALRSSHRPSGIDNVANE
jgi:hypothetical protein